MTNKLEDQLILSLFVSLVLIGVRLIPLSISY